MIRHLIWIPIALLVSIGISGAFQPATPQGTTNYAMNINGYYIKNTNDFQQDVSGEGYAMVYQYVNTNNLSLKNYMHGSGTMDMATLINSQQKSTTVDYLADWSSSKPANMFGQTLSTNNNRDSIITFTEQNQMVQAPYSFPYGTGYYAEHPVMYNSLLKERTEGKNYQGGESLVHQIEYARAFQKDVGVLLNCTGPTLTADGAGFAQMRIDESVTQGAVHVGEMVTDPSQEKKSGFWGTSYGIKNPLVLIDENYVGNFKIKKSMTINQPKAKITQISDWLPCCYGGYNDIYTADARETLIRASEQGVFDCTCRALSLKTYKPAWNGTVAQFPEKVYGKNP